MRIGILDIDSQMKRDNRKAKRKYPNIACGKIYGYHKSQGDEVIYPWDDQNVDRLYISTIFTSSRATIERNMWMYDLYADEIWIGGTGWDDYSVKPYKITKLPPEIDAFDEPQWIYEMYDIDYGIGFTTRGCGVGCSFCVVPKKEGLIEYRDTPISKLINPKLKHLVLMNNNSFADDGFLDDVKEIKDLGLSIHWDQANDITLVTEKVAKAISGVNYRSFDSKRKELFFAFDLMFKTKTPVLEDSSKMILEALDLRREGDNFYFSDGSALEMGRKYVNSFGDTKMHAKQKMNPLKNKLETHLSVSYDMLSVVPRKVELLSQFGIPRRHMVFYMLMGYNTNEEQDLARVECLKSLGCEIYPMVFRDLTGKTGVDGSGKPQPFHARAMRDWLNPRTGLYRKTPLHDFDRYWIRKEQFEAEEWKMMLS